MCKFGLRIIAKTAFFRVAQKVHGANFVFCRLAQKYLVQIQHFFAWPKTILQKYNGS